MDFTPEERSLIAYYAQQEGALRHWGFHLALLTPILMFGGYGLLRRDIIALALAFFALLGVVLWYVLASRRYGQHLGSICHKLELAQPSGTSPQP